MGCEDFDCLIGLLSRRHDLLTLLQEGTRTKGELQTALGVSRSTVDRAIRSLEAESIVNRESGGVSLTQYGRVVLSGCEQFRNGLVGLESAKPLFSSFDTDRPIPFDFFRDVDVVTSDRQSPHRPITAWQQFLDDASEVQSVITGLVPEYVRTYHTQVVEYGVTAEVVVEPSVLERLLTTHTDSVNDMIDTDRFEIYEMSTEPTYSVNVGDTDGREAAMLTYGERGITGFLRSSRPEAVAWAETIFERQKSDATLVTPTE